MISQLDINGASSIPRRALVLTLLREFFTRRRAPRIPEPRLVMDAAGYVDAYVETSRSTGIFAALHLFHACHACDVIRTGDTVVDLGCGPASQLFEIARLNPQARFIGVDASAPMLDAARKQAATLNTHNVEFMLADITRMPAFANASADVVISTMTLHHLDSAQQLDAAVREIARILKPNAGIYIADLCHLKNEKSMRVFVDPYTSTHSTLFMEDYMHSMRAAFYPQDFARAMVPLAARGRVFHTFGVSHMQAFKSAPRNTENETARNMLCERIAALPRGYLGDMRGINKAFQVSGMRSEYMPF